MNSRYCQTSVVLRALVMMNLTMAVYNVLSSTTISSWVSHMSTQALVVEPVIFAWLIAMCPLSQIIGPKRLLVQVVVGMLLAALLTVVLVSLVQWLPFGGTWLGWLPFRAPFVAAVLALVFMLYLELDKRGMQTAETQILLTELQERIRPHFLFNALNSASALIASEPKKAERVIENLSALFRTIISKKTQMHSLKEELQLCARYLEIEQVRFAERMKVEWKLAAGFDSFSVPILSIQPLVENAVKHGVETSEKQCIITISVRKSLTQLVIEVINTLGLPGKGGSGMALNNIEQRLKLIYDLNAKFEHKVSGNLHIARLSLPL